MIDDSVIYEIATVCAEYSAPFNVAGMLSADFVNLCIDEFLNGRKYGYYCAEHYFLHRYLSCVCCMIRAWVNIYKLPYDEYEDVLLDLDGINKEVQRGLLDFGGEEHYSYDAIWYVQRAIVNLNSKLATALHECGCLEMWGTRQMLQEYCLDEEPTANAESSDTSTVSLEFSSETRNVVSDKVTTFSTTLSSDWNSSYSVTPTEALESSTNAEGCMTKCSTLLSQSAEDSQLDADALFTEDFAKELAAQEPVYPEPLPHQIL